VGIRAVPGLGILFAGAVRFAAGEIPPLDIPPPYEVDF